LAEIILEPYAVRQCWRLPGADPDWQGFLGEYLSELARVCQSSGRVVIGHIKALAVFQQGGYYRVSVVRADLPVTSEGSIPAGIHDLELTLNLIVYGLSREHLTEVTQSVSAELAIKFAGQVNTQPQPENHHHH
jgi:hypothetical protein